MFVLQTSSDLSSVQFWGVAAVQTNFDFLQQYGIFLSGSALIEINTTSTTKTETLSLEGVPGGPIFAVATAGYVRQARGAADRHLRPGRARLGLGEPLREPRRRPQRRRAGRRERPAHDRVRDRPGSTRSRTSAALTLQNAQVEGVVAGKEWKILNGDGKPVLRPGRDRRQRQPDPRRQRRAAHLQPRPAVSFELEVIGAMTIYDPSTLSSSSPTEWVHIDGGFLLKITAEPDDVLLHGRRQHRADRDLGPHDRAADPAVPGADLAGDPGNRRDLQRRDRRRNACRAEAAAPRAGSARSRASSPSEGKVQVTLNTTLEDQVFHVPQEFLAVLPSGFPTSITIPKSAPEIDGSTSSNLNARGAYIQAIVTGLDHPRGRDHARRHGRDHGAGRHAELHPDPGRGCDHDPVPRLALRLDRPGRLHLVPVRLRRTPSTRGSSAASRSRSTRASIPGVSIGGSFLLEVNLFLNTTADATDGDVHHRGRGRPGLHRGSVRPARDQPGRVAEDRHRHDPQRAAPAPATATDDREPRHDRRRLHVHLQREPVRDPGHCGREHRTAGPRDARLRRHPVPGRLPDRLRRDRARSSRSARARSATSARGVGLGFSASATLSFSTASYTKTITDRPRPHLHDPVRVPALDLGAASTSSGSSRRTARSRSRSTRAPFTLDFNVDIVLGPIDLQASGFAGVYFQSGHSGLVLQLDVSINFNILEHRQDHGRRPDPPEHDARLAHRERRHDGRPLLRALHQRHGQPARRDQGPDHRARGRRRRHPRPGRLGRHRLQRDGRRRRLVLPLHRRRRLLRARDAARLRLGRLAAATSAST